MKIIVADTKKEGSKVAFDLIKESMNKGIKTLGLATGSTPVDLYKEMTNSDLDFSNMTSVNLDEYVGLAPEDTQSYRYFMQDHLFNQKPFAKTFVPNGLAKDADEETARYNKVIEDNPIDLQILGIGRNGHIGFNEPGSSFDEQTHKVALTESTIEANSVYFENKNDVPRYAYSMGIASIMKSKEIILMAFGKNKAEAIKGMVEGPVTEDLPASVLQTKDNVTVIIDKDAASLLSPSSLEENK
ncbi:glucosamine-6-phosphate deaminase [Lactobacillus terrae]|uniref:glucosamine-6-phosphate deaminase n=1 Tax=Lactobacillus terrae TaxID=2269374 RepID=UPI000C1B6C5F|nr:glucosamine-6-phosphate deaminase [Lactobacillus terrae]